MKTIKNRFNRGCTRLWLAVKNTKGTVITENLGITVAVIVAVFALSAIAFVFLNNYSTGIFSDIQDKGGIGSDFGGGITFD